MCVCVCVCVHVVVRLRNILLSKKLKFNTYKSIVLPVVLCGCETWSLLERGAEVKDV